MSVVEIEFPVITTVMASPAPSQVTCGSQSTGAMSPSEPKPCPWSANKQTAPPKVQSFSELMSEELAKDLQEKEDHSYAGKISGDDVSTLVQEKLSLNSVSESSDEEGTLSDEVLARMLQEEYDREHDKYLSKCETKINANSKVRTSLLNFRLSHSGTHSDEEQDFDDYDSDDHLDEDKSTTFSKKGIAGKGKSIVTKHDAKICATKNANKVMEFPPGFETGDGRGMQLPNHVYNVLKVHSRSEGKRGARVRDKQEKATAELAVDPRTRLLLYKFINSGLLDSISGCISTGKESTVFHAVGGTVEGREVPSECAIKVFKTTLNEFKNREQYISDDYRFAHGVARQNPRSFIKAWAEKEMHNLNRMRRVGIPCPEVVQLKKHILVMTFIGHDHVPAPKLKEAVLNSEQREQAYQQCVQLMKAMYKANLVHADLSEYNMLWHNSQVWLIDVSQAVEPVHQSAMEFLLRDCTNVSQFFSKIGVPGVMTASQLFNEVTGLGLKGEGMELLAQVQDFEKHVDLVTHGMTATGKDYNFDYYFNMSTADRQKRKNTAENLENGPSDEDTTE